MARIPLRAGLLTSIDLEGNPRLLGGTCHSCGRPHFPKASDCPYCGASETAEIELSERGVLHLSTAVLRAPPGYGGPVPYGFGLVDLPEGLRVVSRLVDFEALTPGQSVRLVLESLGENDGGDTLVGWAFAPVKDGR